ncbi:glycosyltransferase [Ideonella sp. BN130291]|uniref:glycosyltransferase n=1 Tax=Ideonella sp. BN130291 TaxID=3112940 RepID=UPI002E273B8B|nr:glycosyltransferase [Ideonella sp. BN130291]
MSADARKPGSPRPRWRSFWMAGFEGADHRNRRGEPIDMARITGHAALLEADYEHCARMGLRTVRESIGWRLAEPHPGVYDFTRLRRIAQAARRHGMQVLWTLMHYGMPDDLHVLHPDFVPRFVRFASAAARELAAQQADEPPVVTPINEIGFLAWVLSETERIAGTPQRVGEQGHESSLHSGYAIKCHLVHAALEAMKAMRGIEPAMRFLHVEPLVHVVAPREAPQLQPLADQVAGFQWQVWDLLCGRAEPQLGGAPQWLDLLGLNHYHNGQWEVGTEKRLKWHLQDPRRRPFGDLALAAWERYRHPMIVAETSHVGIGRAAWLHDIALEVQRVRTLGVPLDGLCLYPIVDRPGWDALDRWHNSGLWDAAVPGQTPRPTGRVLCRPYAKALRRWQQRMELAPTTSNLQREHIMTSPLIVFSHLRWDFVFQRPQHLLSRIAHQHRVIFIEEPIYQPDATPHFEVLDPCDNVRVLRPISNVEAPGFHDDQLAVLKPLVKQMLQDEDLEDYLVWFYTPMALPLLAGLNPEAVIYDCMDELSLFKGAPKQMRQRESALLKRADLVLTGGPSLYENKRDLNPNVHCLPSSVDAAHYAPERITQAHQEYLAAEQLQGHILAPRIGFFGVIDERLDLDLIARLAESRPDWHVVMVGPVVKVDPAALPQRDNIHWLGQQTYARLPALVAGWDVCILPFALNEHTRFISPTKTLEYLAAEKPVVSTPVNDVVGMYGQVVRIAASPEEFVAACDAALQETPAARADRLAQGAATVARYSWDESARTVLRLMDEAVARAAAAQASADAADDEEPQPRVAAAGGVA